MTTLLKSLLLTLCCFAGVAAHAAGPPDTQWTYKTINDKALKMDVLLPEGYASDEKSFPAIVFYHGGGWTNFSSLMRCPIASGGGDLCSCVSGSTTTWSWTSKPNSDYSVRDTRKRVLDGAIDPPPTASA